MKPLVHARRGVRTHLAIYAALVLLFGVVSLLSYHYRSASINQLEASLSRDIIVLGRMPEVRGLAHRIVFTTEFYAKTGDEQYRTRRLGAVADLRILIDHLRRVAGERIWIDELAKRADQLIQAAEARTPGSLREREYAVVELASQIGENAAVELQRRASNEEGSYHRWFLARLLVEFFGAGLVGLYLYFFMLRPIQAAERAAGSWTLGKPWPKSELAAIPEMRALLAHFAGMAERLNGTFEKDREFSEFKTKLVSIASHEFGNALAVILNAAFLLEERASPAVRKRDHDLFRMIKMHSQMLASVAANFLNMGRLEAGKLAMALSETDLSAAVRDTGERLAALAAAKDVALKVVLPAEVARAPADPPALNMVLNNLASNAIKYTPSGGTVTLGVLAEAEGEFVIYVSDTGIGMSEEDQHKILTGYYRTDSGKKMTAKGFGIGLALARQIVEAHGSVLELTSEPGKGSKFSFKLRPARG
jgi:signal transduction histidine kinase